MSHNVTCPYCENTATLVWSTEIYGPGHDYGWMYACKPCEAWVGCHPGTQKPLGRLANAELRQWKMNAHEAFDPLWKRDRGVNPKRHRKLMKRGVKMHRSEAYSWLARQMGLHLHETHIGMFDVEQCKRVVTICAQREVDELAEAVDA